MSMVLIETICFLEFREKKFFDKFAIEFSPCLGGERIK
jgi:hypothetical protein